MKPALTASWHNQSGQLTASIRWHARLAVLCRMSATTSATGFFDFTNGERAR